MENQVESLNTLDLKTERIHKISMTQHPSFCPFIRELKKEECFFQF